jgi:Ion channel/Protein of unknown function (DUF1345)
LALEVRVSTPSSLAVPSTPHEWDLCIPYLRQRTSGYIVEILRKLDALDYRATDIWRYWDFLYFSIITQTTVGFGDILPNSTSVRMLVSIQILCGYLMCSGIVAREGARSTTSVP